MEDVKKKMHSHMEDHHKTHYRGKHHTSAPYGRGEMSKAMHCSQGKLGIGLGHERKEKMPNYDTFGEVLSVEHGHHDVKGKI